MNFKQAIEEIGGLKYVVGLLNIRSSAGRKFLLSLPFLTQKDELERVFDESGLLFAKWNDDNSRRAFSILETKLSQLRDISSTLRHLNERNVMDDVELFEIKHFALLSNAVREITEEMRLTHFQIPDLLQVIDILDPEQKRIPHFYIYDQYSTELAELREKINQATLSDKETLLFEAEKLENNIRKEISEKLRPHAQAMQQVLSELARLDVELAKAEQAATLSLSKPQFSSKNTDIKEMFHPQVAFALSQQGKSFQRIDIKIPAQPTLITGANMAGKSVLLKTVALIQTMAQFGFYVPAASAKIVPVEEIFISAGDGQDEMNGLSSFASEMLRINQTVTAIKKGTKALVLIDELARTTNPAEGKAIVCGMLDFLIENAVRALITTHYSIHLPCRKLRVKGFIELESNPKIDSKNINNYIDYSLEETTDNEVPHEAVKIAEIIGVDDDILERTKKYLKK